MTTLKKGKAGGAILKQRQFSLVESGDWLIGTDVWVPSLNEEILFDQGRVLHVEGANVQVDLNGEIKSVALKECRNFNSRVDPLLLHDVARLTHINDAAVLDFLKVRYHYDLIYTYAAQLLVAVNPFRTIPSLYSDTCLKKYQAISEDSDLPPHTYAVAHKAATLFHEKRKNQSCIVSGESGSGKTETARQLMQFFAFNEVRVGSDQSVQDIILGSSPLLESFGNAKTLRNNNSSRFGRFVKLGLLRGGGIAAGEISQYMLELSRIDVQQQGERNYHIFYQLCNHLPPDLSTSCLLRNEKWYTFLNQSGTYSAESVNDAKDSQDVQRELKNILPIDQIKDLYCALSAILLCGNLEFRNVTMKGTDEAAEITNRKEFQDIATLLGIPIKPLEDCVTVKITTVGGQSVASPVTSLQAIDIVRTLAKEVYATIFDWIVRTVNIKIEGPAGLSNRWVGILDIYGFEFFDVNSMEQFLINYANEKLQQFFVQSVFRSEVEEYEAEGIDHSMIVYEDNEAIITLIDGPKGGILALLEEQSLLGTGTAVKFTSSCHTSFEKHQFYMKPKLNSSTQFGIHHTAVPVMYTTDHFITKNKLKMPSELILILKASTNSALQSAFSSVEILDPHAMKGKFVGSKFSVSMNKLLTVLRSSNAHFIRCIKPNKSKEPQIYAKKDVLGQLHSLSILEAVFLAHKGFAYKATYQNFIEENQILINLVAGGEISGESMDIVNIVLKKLGVPSDQWQTGKSRVFIRKEGWLLVDDFFKKALVTIKPLIARIQGAYQSHMLRRRHQNRLKAVVRLQSVIRRYHVVEDSIKKSRLLNLVFGAICFMKLLRLREIRTRAAIFIQKCVRGWFVRNALKDQIRKIRKARYDQTMRTWGMAFTTLRKWKTTALKNRQNDAAIMIQKCFRGMKARKFFNKYKKWRLLNHSATRIQSIFRGYQVRQRFKIFKWLTPYVLTIQRVWRGYRLRCGAHMEPFRLILQKIQLSQKKQEARLIITTAARTYLIQKRVSDILEASLTLQAMALPQILQGQMQLLETAILTIQGWWRGDRVRRIIREEKLKFLVNIKALNVNEQEKSEFEMINKLHDEVLKAFQKVKRKRLNNQNNNNNNIDPQPGLELIHISLSMESTEIYPQGYYSGWVAGLSKLRDLVPMAGISQLACGAFHTLILTSTNLLYTYGVNDNLKVLKKAIVTSKTHKAHPFNVEISCGADHSLLLTHDGIVFAWGSNERGQCGTRPLSPILWQPEMVRFKNKIKIVYLSAGSFHNAAIAEDSNGGGLFVWGRSDDLNIEGIKSDIRTPLKLRHGKESIGDICRVECGLGCTFILNECGDVFAFGMSRSALLGLGPTVQRTLKPKKISSLQKIVDLQVGSNFALAVTFNGDVWQWGTVLEWDPCIHQATKLQLCTPMMVAKATFDNKSIEVCGAGWWEAVVMNEAGNLYGWSIFQHCGDGEFIPKIYSYDMLNQTQLKRFEVVSCPAFTAVLGEIDYKKKEELLKEDFGESQK